MNRVLRTAPLLLLCLAATPGRAVPESELPAAFDERIYPYYYGQQAAGTLIGQRDVPLDYVTFERDNEKGALVLLHGRGGSHIHLAELIYDLRDSGWSIYSMDHRGQGFSGRMLANRFKGHVEDFDFYSKDIKTFMDTVVNRRPHARVVVLGISMGGAIATTFAQQYPDDVDGLILSVPMHKPNYRPFTEMIALGLGVGATLTFQSEEYGPTQGDPSDEPEVFEENRGTHSRVRWEWDAELNRRVPEIRLGGVTYGWAFETVKANRLQRSRAVEMRMPILLLQASADSVVMNDGQDAFCQRAPLCRKVVIEGARHGLLTSEADEFRDQALGEIRSFLDSEPPAACSCATPGTRPALSLVIFLAIPLAWWRRRRR